MEKKHIVVPVNLSDVGYPVLSELSRELVAMMREKDAPNFIGLQLDDEQGTPWMLTIQRVEGETPEMQCGRLRAQLTESERRRVEFVEAVRPVVDKWSGWKAWLQGSDEEIDELEKISFIGVPRIAAGVTKAQLDALAALVGEDEMSENKCPCCGCPMKETYLGFVCPADNCAFRCSTNSLTRIAAALELAKAHVTLENAMEPLNSGKLKMGEAMPAIRIAMEDARACEQRVMEVFK